MSTFKGIVAEFPQIRIDHFRSQPGYKAPLACFLSHVHSDHLVGLETLRAPFVYCSVATREILLRLEKYHYRVNFARGILESRNVTYDKSMRGLAKALPLDTPTVIELDPKNKIRVTLLDANHCVGAVMFLIQGDHKAILYTGDIRAETWWVNSLVQNPILLPYALGIRDLDCIYLDTTFATKAEPYSQFPSKAEGIRELLQKVEQYSSDTIFYFHAWTFGYENVWIALCAFLGCQIHVDEYRARIYASLSTLEKKHLREAGLDVKTDNKYLRASGLEAREASALCGFRNGNRTQSGCLTSNSSVRIHSCELGMGCPMVDQDTDAKIVHIIPIVTRVDGTEVAEIGAGGGKGDLDQREELETVDVGDVGKLMELCAKQIPDGELLSRVLARLQTTLDEGKGNIDLGAALLKENQYSDDDLSLQTLVSLLSSHASSSENPVERQNETIRFPYSRHSSYSELCTLVEAFHPRDVYPCTVDEARWHPTLGMRSLFGPFCSENTFRHDAEMTDKYEAQLGRERRGKRERAQTSKGNTAEASASKQPSQAGLQKWTTPRTRHDNTRTKAPQEPHPTPQTNQPTNPPSSSPPTPTQTPKHIPPSHPSLVLQPPNTTTPSAPTPTRPPTPTPTPNPKPKPKPKQSNRAIAYQAALGIHLTWADYGGLVSTRKQSDDDDEEL